MRVLEPNSNFERKFLITQNINYFTIRYSSGVVKCYMFSDIPLKYKDKNKTRILYKDAKLNYSKEIKVTDNIDCGLDRSNRTLNWMGIYNENSNTFFRNPLYTGSISLSEVISKLQGK